MERSSTRNGNPLHWLSPLVYLGLAVTAFAITRPGDPASLGAPMAVGVVLVAVVRQIWLRHRVWPRPDSVPPLRPVAAVPAGTDPAVAAVPAARSRRAEARRIVADDPLLGRDLTIGRPDLPRDYDDGGLVDLNSAPAAASRRWTTCPPTPTSRSTCGTGSVTGRWRSAADRCGRGSHARPASHRTVRRRGHRHDEGHRPHHTFHLYCRDTCSSREYARCRDHA